jgi:hypothetical protein
MSLVDAARVALLALLTHRGRGTDPTAVERLLLTGQSDQ